MAIKLSCRRQTALCYVQVIIKLPGTRYFILFALLAISITSLAARAHLRRPSETHNA
jgi:hypothetical protein